MIFLDDVETNPEDNEGDDVEWSMDSSEQTQKSCMRELGAVASILEQAPSSDDRDVALERRACMDNLKKPKKVVAKSSKILGKKNAIRRIIMAAAVDGTPATVPASVLDRAAPVFKHLGEPMEAHTQSGVLDYFDWVAGHGKAMLPVISHILKHGYDCDIF